jgi:D-alanyl-D-alanine dipeptidase
MCRSLAAILFAIVPTLLGATNETGVETAIAKSKQLIVVSAREWSANRATLSLYERASDRSWRRISAEVPVMLGRNGLAWGVGLHKQPATKREGDGRSPAGVFDLEKIYGRDVYAPSSRFPYQQLSATMEGVDDPKSRYYNRLLDGGRVEDRDWTSSEKVRPVNPMFRWCVEVRHNWEQRPGLGSCIYLHIWKAPGVATSGCTAMSEAALERLVRWLDSRKRPLLVQLSEKESRALHTALGK